MIEFACAASSAIAIGMNGTRTYGHPSPLNRKRRRLKGALAAGTLPGGYR